MCLDRQEYKLQVDCGKYTCVQLRTCDSSSHLGLLLFVCSSLLPFCSHYKHGFSRLLTVGLCDSFLNHSALRLFFSLFWSFCQCFHNPSRDSDPPPHPVPKNSLKIRKKISSGTVSTVNWQSLHAINNAAVRQKGTSCANLEPRQWYLFKSLSLFANLKGRAIINVLLCRAASSSGPLVVRWWRQIATDVLQHY